MAVAEGRTYGGLSAGQRSDDRRERWIAAGQELFATRGFAATTIRSLARESGVPERYFAENFTSLEDLLVAVDERIHDEMESRVSDAARAAYRRGDDTLRPGLEAMIDVLIEEPKLARIKFLESLAGGVQAEARRRLSMQRLADFLIRAGKLTDDRLPRDVPPAAVGIALSGAVAELMMAVFLSDGALSRTDFIAAAIAVVEGAGTHPG